MENLKSEIQPLHEEEANIVQEIIDRDSQAAEDSPRKDSNICHSPLDAVSVSSAGDLHSFRVVYSKVL